MAESKAVKRVKIAGLHNHQELDVELHPQLSILHGANGSGKTTLLHTLANLMEGDVDRFCFLQFSTIDVETYAGHRISLSQRKAADEKQKLTVFVDVSIDGSKIASITPGEPPQDVVAALGTVIGPEPVYLPAFRSILDATPTGGRGYPHYYRPDINTESPEFQAIIARERARGSRAGKRSARSYDDPSVGLAFKTLLCRRWFGEFVPTIRYPSLQEVESSIDEEMRTAFFHLSRSDEQTLSNVFLSVLQAIKIKKRKPSRAAEVNQLVREIKARLETFSKTQDGPFQQLSELIEGFSGKYARGAVRDILKVYAEALTKRERTQVSLFKSLERLQSSVNKFLQGKSLELNPSKMRKGNPRAAIRSAIGDSLGFSALSSGERHVLTMLFSATHVSSEGIMLIDEPELSLHVDWQRIILSEVMTQVGQRQIISCTHSPEIAAYHREYLVEVGPEKKK